MDFDWPRARKRLSNLIAEQTACFFDLERLLRPEIAKKAFSRDSSLANAIDVIPRILSNSVFLLDSALHHIEDYKKMNVYASVRSTIHIAEDILDESTKILTHLERRRRVKFFMVAAGDVVSSARSEDPIADMVYHVGYRMEDQHKNLSRMFEQRMRWLVINGPMTTEEAEVNIRKYKYPNYPPPEL